MSKTLYVGNLPWGVREDELRRLFAAHITVRAARVILDRESGRSRGFGFVEVNEEEAERAIMAMNGAVVNGRPLIVNAAEPRQSAESHQS